ncbi:Acetyltransferase (GNAT) family protein [Sinomicrobium oceani]|uniref:Acetyltransferase (GNAT) family protein n=1 Tax=Sinomicrobium oceani TaxID=1150368 RepID=A0A1K1NTS3_9FLAO|nr:GNAT family N-acetyltransferase [Sinomicrobium oceani]SFW38719.1 Acetyltransferase (GNAT) family protein [Sinomicrobium oceani]
MVIRKATKEDSGIIARYIMLAMEDIAYEMTGRHDPHEVTAFLEDLVRREDNQYTYAHCWVAEVSGEIAGMALVYDGALLDELRRPVAESIRQRYNRSFTLEKETQAGEFYIDCIAVNPAMQGKGIGSALLRFLVAEYVTRQGEVLGLLVDRENPNARKLYLKTGFTVSGEKILAGKSMEHLQYTKR